MPSSGYSSRRARDTAASSAATDRSPSCAAAGDFYRLKSIPPYIESTTAASSAATDRSPPCYHGLGKFNQNDSTHSAASRVPNLSSRTTDRSPSCAAAAKTGIEIYLRFLRAKIDAKTGFRLRFFTCDFYGQKLASPRIGSRRRGGDQGRDGPLPAALRIGSDREKIPKKMLLARNILWVASRLIASTPAALLPARPRRYHQHARGVIASAPADRSPSCYHGLGKFNQNDSTLEAFCSFPSSVSFITRDGPLPVLRRGGRDRLRFLPATFTGEKRCRGFSAHRQSATRR